MPQPRRLHPDEVVEAAGYIRVSSRLQGEGYSPEVQREQIKTLAAQLGYALTLIEEDHERGSKITRAGYQRILSAVREGNAGAVIVYMFDRFGRDGVEWLTRAKELERLGVPIISVQEGRDEGGLMRFIRAGMAEEYSRQLAQRVLPARARAARSGTHMGPTPLGYMRLYPAWDGHGRRPPADLIVDEAMAWVVRELFSRYAAGGWSLRDLVGWLARDERVPPAPSGKVWATHSIKALLHNPIYAGWVRYNHRPVGFYERAAPGSMFVERGRHEALISQETFDAVQQRMAAAATRQSYNRHDGPRGMGHGLLRCAGCGGPMRLNAKDNGIDYYECGWRNTGRPCATRSYLASLAHAALLAEVGRLRGLPWTGTAERRLLGWDTPAKADAGMAISRALDEERERLRRHTRRLSLLEDDPTPEQLVSFREVSAEISARIRALEAQIAPPQTRPVDLPSLRRLHNQISQNDMSTLLMRLEKAADTTGLNTLLHGFIDSACITERVPGSHPVWVRAVIIWHPDVTTLVDVGLLQLDAPLQAPRVPTHADAQLAANRRYRERHREERNATRREQRAAKKAQLRRDRNCGQ